jgi:hypothetical protein
MCLTAFETSMGLVSKCRICGAVLSKVKPARVCTVWRAREVRVSGVRALCMHNLVHMSTSHGNARPHHFGACSSAGPRCLAIGTCAFVTFRCAFV